MKNLKEKRQLCWVCMYNDEPYIHYADRIIDSKQHKVKDIEIPCCARCAIAYPFDVRRLALKIKENQKVKAKKHLRKKRD